MSDDEPPSSRPQPPRAAARPAFDVAVEIAAGGWRDALPDAPALARAAASAALAAAGHGPLAERIEIGVRLSDDDELRALNARHRGIDRPTNVLSFAAADCAPGRPPELPAAGAPLALGDLVVALGTTAREARLADRPLANHFSHLIVHGTLHLVGHDHETEADAAAMECLETAILAGLDVPDPYSPPSSSPSSPGEPDNGPNGHERSPAA